MAVQKWANAIPGSRVLTVVVLVAFTVAVIIGVATVTAALMSVDSHTPMAVCSNSPNIRH